MGSSPEKEVVPMGISMETRPITDPGVDPIDLSIIVPVYNEAEGLAVLIDRLEALRNSLADTTAEIIFVDDHSSDESPRMLAEICERHANVRVLRLSSNSGSHVAIYAGLEHAHGSCAVFLAADLQDPPELVPQMLALWRQGYQLVWAVRDEREGIRWTDRTFARMFYATFNRLAQASLPPQGSDFVLMDRAVVEALKRSIVATPFLMGEIARLGFRATEVAYRKRARQFGRTKWTLGRKLRLFADAFVSSSYVPLRVMSYAGLACSCAGFAYALFIVVRSIGWAIPVQGWASLMVVLLVLGGIQMTMLGVLGEYLWRTLEASRRRPLYFIEHESTSTRPAVRSGSGFKAERPVEVAGAMAGESAPAAPAAAERDATAGIVRS
jgi:glycosyltransferase involved in cell wall biosynthesis